MSELWVAKCLEGSTRDLVTAVVQYVLGDTEEKSRKSSFVEGDITAEIRTRYLPNTSLDRSSSC
jgi:hypothetical protein